MTRDCQTCGGEGAVNAGRRTGPCEWSSIATCGDCNGSGRELVRCEICGDAEAKREAWVMDHTNSRKASLLYLCLDCHDHDSLTLAEPPTRVLPARIEHVEAIASRATTVLAMLVEARRERGGHA